MYKLPAIMSSCIADLLMQRELLFSLVDALGSPIHVIAPSEFEHNIRLFRKVFSDCKVEGRIWYAYKVNKTLALLEVAARQNIGVEVSSLAELQLALGHGILGEKLGVSGPLKDVRFLLLAIQQRCTIVLDSLEELKNIAAIAKTMKIPHQVNVMVRLSGFEVTTQGRSEPAPARFENGRFGIALTEMPELYRILSQDEIRSSIQLSGFGFHIDNHSVRDRAEAIAVAIEQIYNARSLGYLCRDIDMGGGFSVRYVQSDDWNTFLDEYAASVQGKQPPIMFRDKSFGLIIREGQRVNRGNFYPYVTEAYKDDFLKAVLCYIPRGHQCSLSETLRKLEVRLTIEPGKSLVDQVGVTLCRIKGLKRSSRGDQLLLCEMNISHLFEQLSGSEFAVDPVLLIDPAAPARAQSDFFCHAVGNLCLESDVLTWRRIRFDTMPQQGDLLAFVNTAGYQMDFVESKMHQMPLPCRTIVYQNRGQWKWKLDEQFSAIDFDT